MTYGPGPVKGKPYVMCGRELPERCGVEVGEREHMGGEWVKQPEVAKGLKNFWRPREVQSR